MREIALLPPIAIVFKHPAQEADFDALRELLASGGTEVAIESRDEDGPYAGIEWLLPTAVILFIGKAYIDGLVKEIGKDHYILLKQGLKSLYSRLVGPKAPTLTVISTAGKSKAAGEYSLLFSLLAEAPDGLRFKLLIKSAATQEEYEATVNGFVEFLSAVCVDPLAMARHCASRRPAVFRRGWEQGYRDSAGRDRMRCCQQRIDRS